MRRIATIAVGIAAAVLLLVRCLPGDTRPTPGGIFITVAPSDAITNGVTTADGWAITFEKLLISLGNASLHNDSCTDYNSDNGYDRLINLAVPSAGPQKLAQVYGLGSCNLQFRIASPNENAVLGLGVTEADLTLMETPGMDAIVVLGRPVLYAQGHATRNGVTKHFAWTFLQQGGGRGRGMTMPSAITSADGGLLPGLSGRLDDCGVTGDAGLSNTVNLQASDALSFAVTVYGEQLFRSTLDPAAPLTFGPFAEADTNDDQTITQAELDAAPGLPLPADAGLVVADGGLPSLSYFVYQNIADGMIALGGKICPFDNARQSD